MKFFLSCDWGTTTLRIRLVDIEQQKVLVEETSGQGILATFNLWQQAGARGGQQKIQFYLAVIGDCIRKLEHRFNDALNGVKVIISGMASSSAGFIDLPYRELPLPTDGSGVKTALIGASDRFAHDCLIISGVKTGHDVMRGEETQLIGSTDDTTAQVKNGLFIFPGTHSKHIHVQDDQITAFKTYMTGEFFDLLSNNSILKNSVETATLTEDDHLQAFKKGVRNAARENLLHSAFTVRVNDLFAQFSRQQNFAYLSGLIIGTELKELLTDNSEAVNLIRDPNLAPWYCAALDELKIKYMLLPCTADEATIKGQLKIGRQLNFVT